MINRCISSYSCLFPLASCNGSKSKLLMYNLDRFSKIQSQITFLACLNALGTVLPPMVIFTGEHLNYKWTEGEIPNVWNVAIRDKPRIQRLEKSRYPSCDATYIWMDIHSITQQLRSFLFASKCYSCSSSSLDVSFLDN